MPDYIAQRAQWFKDHPEYTLCKLCQSVTKVRGMTDGLCRECADWQIKLTPLPSGNQHD
jgi:hypothetical protein